MKPALYLILSYLTGSIPFAYIIARIFKKVDIRHFGSGNPGATNVYRISKPLGIATFFCDMLKGFLPVYLVKTLEPSSGILISAVILTVILGHMFTVFLNFKGGKGVATGCGAFFAVAPASIVICLIVFAVILAISKYVSVASICAAAVLPVSVYIFNGFNEIFILSVLTAVIVIIKHFGNIKRILTGTENRI